MPGIGPTSARRIVSARRTAHLRFDDLKQMGVVLKRAQYFITCRGFSGAHPGRGSARTGAHHPGAHRPQRIQRRSRAAEYVQPARR